MEVPQQRKLVRKLCVYENQILKPENHLELDTIAIIQVQDIKQDIGLVENGNET